MAEPTSKKSFSENELTEKDRALYKFANKRIQQMQNARQRTHYGVKLNDLWAEADRDYVPHRLGTAGKKIIVTDEDKGWRSTVTRLGSANWQSDLAQPNPFIKIQTALSILVDQNPGGTFTATMEKYEATTELMRQLYRRSWEVAKSKQQLKLFVHNLAKYGWACARTFPLKLTRKTRVYIGIDKEGQPAYEEKEVMVYNDIYRENLDPRNTWIDDLARPNDQFSLRDWCYRKVYSLNTLKELFPKEKYPLIDQVQSGGITDDVIDTQNKESEKPTEDEELVEVYFYENIEKDLYLVTAGSTKVPLIIDPLLVSDTSGRKRLSLWQGYWNIRHTESPYGIGIYEAIRNDNAFLDKVRNMTVDEIVLSIYKMFFYTGTQALQDTGEIRISPGVGKQVLNPKDITWLEIPGPGKDAYAGIEMFKRDLDEASGITDPLMGKIVGKTAFELAQAKEAALKRLKTPLDNLLDALETDGYITVSLAQIIYSTPEIIKITDPDLQERYLNEIQSDPELFERNTDQETGEESFFAKTFPQFPLNLEEDEKHNLIESEKTRFIHIKPSGLSWEGIIHIKAETILSGSKQIDKALDLEMLNMFIPLIVQPKEIYVKTAKNLLKLYDKDPKDWLPDLWLAEPPPAQPALAQPEEQPLFVESGAGPQQQADQFVNSPQVPSQPQGMGQRIVSGLSNLFRGQ